MNNQVSVIVPVFNTEEYLEKCLDSIMQQTYSSIEIIIVNDGSTDNSKKICELAQSEDPRIKYFEQENRGLSAARNVGIKKATGDYYAFVDSDDILAPTFIEELVTVCINSNCDVTCCEGIKFCGNKDGKVEKYWSETAATKTNIEIIDKDDAIIDSFYGNKRITEIPFKIYKKRVFDGIVFPEGKIYEDLATTYRLLGNADRIAMLDKKLYGYRLRKNSIFKSGYSSKNLCSVWVAEKISTDLIGIKKFEKAVSSVCFRINRVTFGKVPFSCHEDRYIIWNQIRKYRRTVLLDSHAKKYERLLAMCSYGGEFFFKIVVKMFDSLKYMYYFLYI